MCNRGDNRVINNIDYRRLQRLSLLFKLPMGTQKDFFKVEESLGTRCHEDSPAVV
jgi:hypothetical protein